MRDLIENFSAMRYLIENFSVMRDRSPLPPATLLMAPSDVMQTLLIEKSVVELNENTLLNAI